MIDIKKCISLFNNYFKTFDIKNKLILLKFHHTYRVMDFAHEIAVSENLSEEDIKLAEVCGLLHDIARFKQITEYNTFIDQLSFDHGDMGYNILLENNFIDQFTNDEEIKNIILKSVKYHNKKEVDKSLNERELLFANIIRDADKLDIMREQNNCIIDNDFHLKQEIVNSIFNKELVKNDDTITDIDNTFRCISFIFDINFKYSFKFIVDNEIVEKKIHLIETNIQDEKIEQIKKVVNNYIKERMS